MNLRDAAQQALEALTNCNSEHGHRCNRCDSEVDEGGKVASALRAALAEPVQEPVAWRWRMRHLTDAPGFVQPWTVTTYYPREQANEIEPLYTAPPQRKPLTEEEIKGIYEDCDAPTGGQFTFAFARAIERAHGIGGQE